MQSILVIKKALYYCLLCCSLYKRRIVSVTILCSSRSLFVLVLSLILMLDIVLLVSVRLWIAQVFLAYLLHDLEAILLSKTGRDHACLQF